MPGLKQLDGEPRIPQARVEPLRQWTRLEPDPARGNARSANQRANASGSLATFASRTIHPVASTTQTLDCSSETSIPA